MTMDRVQKDALYEIACLHWKEFNNRMIDSWTLENYQKDTEYNQAIKKLEREYRETYGELPEWPYIDDVLATIEELSKEV